MKFHLEIVIEQYCVLPLQMLNELRREMFQKMLLGLIRDLTREHSSEMYQKGIFSLIFAHY